MNHNISYKCFSTSNTLLLGNRNLRDVEIYWNVVSRLDPISGKYDKVKDESSPSKDFFLGHLENLQSSEAIYLERYLKSQFNIQLKFEEEPLNLSQYSEPMHDFFKPGSSMYIIKLFDEKTYKFPFKVMGAFLKSDFESKIVKQFEIGNKEYIPTFKTTSVPKK